MDEIFAGHRADVRYAVINLPMFLENLLYQTERLRGFRGQGEEGATSPPSFSFPLKRDTVFSYVTCKSLGELAAGILVEFDVLFTHMEEESLRRRNVFQLRSVTSRTKYVCTRANRRTNSPTPFPTKFQYLFTGRLPS